MIEYESCACCKSRSSLILTATNTRQIGYSHAYSIDVHLRSVLDRFVANVSQTDVANLWRDGGRRHDRAWRKWPIRLQTHQFLRRMPTVFDPHDDLLTNVTAFCETHGVVEIRLRDH